MKQVGYYIAFFVSLLLFGACGKGGCNVVPNVTVRSQFSFESHPNLFSAFASASIGGGVCGLIVFNDGDRFVAYDRCSTVNPDQRNVVEIVGADLVRDPVSGATWSLVNGFSSGKADCPLKPYHVSQVGNIYYVTN